jgi:hypothetical protein
VEVEVWARVCMESVGGRCVEYGWGGNGGKEGRGVKRSSERGKRGGSEDWRVSAEKGRGSE